MTNRLVRVISLVAAVGIFMTLPSAAQQTSTSPGGGGAPGARQRAPGTPRAATGPVLAVTTVKGDFEIELFPNEAPKSVAHILDLVKRNFYNGLRVHRVASGFVVQFGDPQTRDMTKRSSWGNGGSGRAVGVAEIKRPHRLGAVALAHAGDPREADSQMYVALAGMESPQIRNIDGDFTVIGQVISGMPVVQKLQVTDIIRRVTVRAPAAPSRRGGPSGPR